MSTPTAIESMVEMGFSREQAAAALLQCNGNIENAIMAIMENPSIGEAATTESTVVANAENNELAKEGVGVEGPNDSGTVTEVVSELEAAAVTETSASSSEVTVASSIVCNECGKLFRNTEAVQLHAERSGHTDFGESTQEVIILHSFIKHTL